MSSKPTSRSVIMKKEVNSRSNTKHLALEKVKKTNNSKESNSRKGCDCLLKCESWKGFKTNQNSKVVKKSSNKAIAKDGKKDPGDHHEKVVIVSKRSSSVSVVKSCNLRKSVSVRKVSYSTSIVLSSDEDETESEEIDSEEEEKRKKNAKKKKTVLKHTTTSKVKSNYRPNKKSDRAAKKAKAIKLLCEKLSANDKNKDNERELRPRFPYSMLQEWPTARAHRMASLNALAKVHVLYENESRTAGENLKDADETSLIDFLNEENTDDDDDDDDEEEDEDNLEDDPTVKITIRSSNRASEKKNDKSKNAENNKGKNEKKTRVPIKQSKKRSVSDVEIIDTRVCKRMASLNAQAILAASYIPEPKPKRIPRKLEKYDSSSDSDLKEIYLESKCDLEIIETEKQTSTLKFDSNVSTDKNKQEKSTSPLMHLNEVKAIDNGKNDMSTSTPHHSDWQIDSETAHNKSSQTEVKVNSDDNIVSTSSSTKVGVTQYTEVTKVQINSRNDMEVKEESKSERKIERLLGNDDVAITQMYHYQSKNTNESYCVQMQTTYKPGSRNLSPAISMSPNNAIHPHMSDPVLHGRSNYYGCSSHTPMLPAPPYHMSPAVGGMHPVIGMDHRIPHQYGGSAFSVPHYRHPQPIQFPHNEYGYYQPAGPLIQPHHDQYTIHKPVPYHPQPNLHQPPQRPQPTNSHRDPYPTLDGNRGLPNSPAIQSHHTPVEKQNSVMPLHSSTNDSTSQELHSLSHKNTADRSQERGLNNTKPFNTSPKSISPTSLQAPYPVQNSYQEFQKHKSSNSLTSYPKSYEHNIAPPPQTHHNYNMSLSQNISYQKNKSLPQSHLQSQDSSHFHELQNINHQQLEMSSHPAYIRTRDNYKNETQVKENNWSIGTNSHNSSNTPSNFLPYLNEQRKEMPSEIISESPHYPLRPPSVIEITEDNSRDTKTYIQLEVPQNSHREKIVVVDVDDDDINKNCDLPNNNDKSYVDLTQEKDIEHPAEDLPSTDVKIEVKPSEHNKDGDIIHIKSQNDKLNEQSKDLPEVMVIDVKKKKESAVVRRARLHGKQRTFRDAYNRPLVPLSKLKKSELLVSDEHKTKPLTSEESLPPSLPPSKSNENKFAHGWSWEGQPFYKQVYVSNDESPCTRLCYPAIKHVEGDVIFVRDCVLLKSGPRKTDLPFVAKITALWDNPHDGEMTMSLMWYYRPEHTETEKKLHHMEDEIFASKHKDTNSVACIEDKCYVLTYSEYCRYRKKCKLVEDSATSPTSIVPEIDDYPRSKRLPPTNVSPDLVFFCRKVYDFRQKRLLKNPV